MFVCHALTGDAHAAGHHGNPDAAGLVGQPDRARQAARHRPPVRRLREPAGRLPGHDRARRRSTRRTGKPYGLRFPLCTVRDLVTVHRRLLAHLGVERPLAAIGGSVGGMQVLQWAIDHPDELGAGLVICASARLTAQNIAFSAVARAAIMEDENFHGGDYYEHGVRPDNGLSLARRIAHITYLSEESMRAKFGRRLQHDGEPLRGFGIDFAVESYLEYQGESFLNRFDANSYLYLTRVMDYFDPFGDVAPAIERLRGSRDALPRALVRHRLALPDGPLARDRARAHGARRSRSRSARSPRRTATTRSCCRCPSTTARSRRSSSACGARSAREARPRDRRGHGARAARACSTSGCGDGALLAHLIAERGCDGPRRRDRRRRRARAASRAGVPVSEGDIEDASARVRRRRVRRRAAVVDAADHAPARGGRGRDDARRARRRRLASRTSRTGGCARGSRCGAACRSRARCPSRGTRRPTSTSARSPTSSRSRRRSTCA